MRERNEHLQEQHLDMMIHLAFKAEEDDAIQKILDKQDEMICPDEDTLAAHIWEQTQAKMEVLEEEKRRLLHKEKRKQLFPKVLQAAALLILLFAAAMPIAVANSTEFRAKVMQLLVRIDQSRNEAHFTYVEDQGISFQIPEGWSGSYFPSVIPAGMTLIDIGSYLHTVTYADASGRGFSFSELDVDAGVSVGTEDATISYANMNGSSACIIDGYTNDGRTHSVTVVWSNDTQWFTIAGTNMDVDEILAVARNVTKKIFEIICHIMTSWIVSIYEKRFRRF